MLSPEERKIVESFRGAEKIRITVNDGKGGFPDILFIKGSEAFKNLAYNLRWTVQQYMNDVQKEASKRSHIDWNERYGGK